MTNEELLQSLLNSTVERFGRKEVAHEAEIANLNSQIIMLNNQIEEIKKASEDKPASVKPAANKDK